MWWIRNALAGGHHQNTGPTHKAEPTPAPLLVTVSLRAFRLEASVPIMMNTQIGTHYKDPRDPR